MLNRLKSLPLTILLTILIWMYAEAQFMSTQPDVPLSVRIASGSSDYAVRTLDPVDKRYTNILNFVVTLQGPRNQIDQIFQDSQGMHGSAGGDKLAGLTFIPTNDQLRAAAAAGDSAGGSGGVLHPNVLQMLNELEYFRSRGVTVTFASPYSVTIDVLQRAQQSSVAVNAVPIWVSGPPAVLARYDVEVTPTAVNLILSGSGAQVDGLRQRLEGGGAPAAGIYVYLDLTPEDRPAVPGARRGLRYVYPEGLTLLQSPPDAAFKLSEKPPTPVPGAGR